MTSSARARWPIMSSASPTSSSTSPAPSSTSLSARARSPIPSSPSPIASSRCASVSSRSSNRERKVAKAGRKVIDRERKVVERRRQGGRARRQGGRARRQGRPMPSSRSSLAELKVVPCRAQGRHIPVPARKRQISRTWTTFCTILKGSPCFSEVPTNTLASFGPGAALPCH